MRTLHDWFRATARRSPEAIALVSDQTTLTYRHLDRQADRVAAQVGELGIIGAPARVGVLSAPGVVGCVAYLAALRLGAAVVPMHPTYPLARLLDVARTAGLDVLVTDGTVAADQIGRKLSIPVLHLDPERLAAEDPPATEAIDARSAGPDDLAYILFTSGTTGRPKGVPIRHRNLDPFLRHCVRRFQVGPGCRLSQTFPLSFDPSVFDLFAGWSAGATLIVPTQAEMLEPAAFVSRHRLTHWYSVPSVISTAAILDGLGAGSMPSLRHSLFAGEQLTLDQAGAWAVAAPHSAVANLYGPTELTVTVTAYTLPHAPERWPVTSNRTVPIGDSYPHLEHLVVDGEGRPAQHGELYVRGPQRFDGYLDPSDNDGRFARRVDGALVPTAGAPSPTDWYRTGDLVAVEHGGLVHIGRIDDQVKLRGQRFELGEVEVALRAVAGISDAAAFICEPAEAASLTAVYVGAELPSRQLRSGLRKVLASYMIPERFIRVPSLPRDTNGKIDRGALRALGRST